MVAPRLRACPRLSAQMQVSGSAVALNWSWMYRVSTRHNPTAVCHGVGGCMGVVLDEVVSMAVVYPHITLKYHHVKDDSDVLSRHTSDWNPCTGC